MEYKPIDLKRVKTIPLASRQNKVALNDFAKVGSRGMSFQQFLDSLPRQLAAVDFKKVVDAVVKAHSKNRPVIWGMGAHVTKVGLNPLIIEMMRRRILTAVAMNGGASIHDVEIALVGGTSEDVLSGLTEGSFGMVEETGNLFGEALAKGDADKGMGRLLGERLLASNAQYKEQSILATGAKLGIPVTVHVAIGTDIVHMHPGAHSERAGAASFRDFLLFASIVSSMDKGSVYINAGSAVILPEVFLKAVSLAKNLGNPLEGIVTANLDMQLHYRPRENVLHRPTANKGKGYSLIGHHELLIPLIVQGILERIDN